MYHDGMHAWSPVPFSRLTIVKQVLD